MHASLCFASECNEKKKSHSSLGNSYDHVSFITHSPSSSNERKKKEILFLDDEQFFIAKCVQEKKSPVKITSLKLETTRDVVYYELLKEEVWRLKKIVNRKIFVLIFTLFCSERIYFDWRKKSQAFKMFKSHLAMIGFNETPNKKAKFWQAYIRSLKGELTLNLIIVLLLN